MRTNKHAVYNLIPIDEQHLDAVVSDRGLLIFAPTERTKVIFIGHPTRHLKLRDLISEVQTNIFDEQRRGDNITYKQHLKRRGRDSYPWGLDDHEEFRGLQYPCDPSDPTIFHFRI